MKTLRLILGDQLHLGHSWYKKPAPDVIYFMAEMRQETDYTRHHIQKVVAFFLGMRHFAETLQTRGHQLIYWTLDHPENQQDLSANLELLIQRQAISEFQYQQPDEYRLDQQLKEFCQDLAIPSDCVSSEHFLSHRMELARFFEGKKQTIMESFYRYMRKKHGLLMEATGMPLGGQWNFDADNRNKWKGDPAVPELPVWNRDVGQLVDLIQSQGIETIGRIDAQQFPWPVTREEGLELLDHFCNQLLPYFGSYQDAMADDQPFLFHSRLSFMMNAKILSPLEVMEAVIESYHRDPERISISQVEGFVRQILGWREYIRGMYWMRMPEMEQENFLEHRQALPEFYWTGQTKMNCLSQAIGQSLDQAYAHHIQRLMITGNFALLTLVDPRAVDDWYLGIYIDALQWVELPNTRGMSQYADGGKIATKPYISSGNYINKMSNHCSSCHYNTKKRTGEDACPFNALYWNFLEVHRSKLKNNRRMGMMYRLLDKIDPEERNAIRERALHIIEHADAF